MLQSKAYAFLPGDVRQNVNVDFADVVPTETYCYDAMAHISGSLVMKLDTSTSLRLEYRAQQSCDDPWSFTASAASFVRSATP
jgi:hypothetical protein